MVDLAKVEGDEIVIRIPIEAIPFALEYYNDQFVDADDHVIEDLMVFAQEMVRILNSEPYDEPYINEFLDGVLAEAINQGAEGLKYE